MTLFDEEFLLDGSKIDTEIAGRVAGARLIGTMEGAASLELDVWDGDGELLLTGRLATRTHATKGKLEDAAWARFGAMRLVYGGTLWRLAGINGAFPTLTLTFEDEVASLMRRHTRAMTASRGAKSRAEFIGLAASKVKEIAVQYRSPEEGVKQKIDKPDDSAEDKGISAHAHLTVKGVQIDAEQRKNAETVLAVADRLKAGERATLALIDACITESQIRNLTGGDGSSQGILQVTASTAAGIVPRTTVDPRTGQTHGAVTRDATGPIAPGSLDPRDVKEVARTFLLRGFGRGGAIEYAEDNPDAEIWEIAQHAQISGAGAATNGEANYGPWVDEAKAILDAWGGVGTITVLRESFQFRIGGKRSKEDVKPENYWTGVKRLNDEVDGWRLFVWRNVLTFVSDEWLIQRKAVLVVDRKHLFAKYRDGSIADDRLPQVELTVGQVDVGIALSEIRIKAPARRWEGGPGKVCELTRLGPLTGKWLIWENRFDLERDIAELTLRRPAPKAPEPAPSTREVTSGPADAPGGLAYPLAQRGQLIGTPGVGTHYWGQNWQSSNAVDIGVPTGTIVYAVDDGTISPPSTPYSGFGESASGGRFAGKRLHLKTGNNAWFYTHLSEYAEGIEPGAKVSKGDPIGKSGAANGVQHLHLGVERGNPVKLLGLK